MMKAVYGLKRWGRRMVAVGLAVGACLGAAAGEVWTLEKPRVWSREKDAATVSVRDGAVEVRHTGGADWCVYGLKTIDVKPGEAFRFSCVSRKLADVETSRPFGLSVILRDAQGEVMAWTYATGEGRPGEAVTSTFMVPPGGARITPRVTGNGVCGVALTDVKFEALGTTACAGALGAVPAGSALETDALAVELDPTAMLRVTDKRTGRVWAPAATAGGAFVTGVEKDGALRRTVTFVQPESMRVWKAVVELEKGKAEVSVTVTGEGPLDKPLAYPAAFATRAGDRLIVPMNEGISFPADDAADLPGQLITYGGHGLCMSFWGVQDDATGAGYMGLIETPDDAAVRFARDEKTGLTAGGAVWQEQKKMFGYARTVRFVFFDKGGYVAMCKRYRAHAKAVGKFKVFTAKAKERPLVDRLLGAPNIWCWEKDKLGVASNLVAAGIDRFLWSAGGTSEQIQALAKMDKVLVSRYDVYQDVYHPEQLKKLRWTSGSNTEAWPHDIVWNSADSNDWRHAWGVKAKDGTWTHCAMMCDRVAPDYARRKVTKELAHSPYNTRFIDTTVASPWQTCWNPAHPMTRGDSRHWKMELLRVLGDEFGLVVGSETGHDASVPFCDYFEGMLSLGPYRVPDSGRNIPQIWTNAPARVVKYQLGEKYRLPLWELVYHECVCAHWYWGDYNNKLPELWDKRDLFNVLYGTMGMYIFNNKQWAEDKDRFVRSYRVTSPVARATGYSEMLEHIILTPDRSVQRTRFADGTVVTVNFGDAAWTDADGTTLPARTHRVTKK